MRGQIDHLHAEGLIPGIEWSNCPSPYDSYWRLWKLPFVGGKVALAHTVVQDQHPIEPFSLVSANANALARTHSGREPIDREIALEHAFDDGACRRHPHQSVG